MSRETPSASKRLPLNAPVRAWALAEWALLPLRLFLGVTFVYAGLQKLANPNFFNAKSPISIQAELKASVYTSPLHGILTHLEPIAILLGILIAVGELAVGIGTLLGLFTRVAAVGGLVLSLILFLTVSFHSSPYFTGADIVFFFAWTALLITGGGSQLSADGWLASRSANVVAPASTTVPIAFGTVQNLCGNYNNGQCAALDGNSCSSSVCPVLLGTTPQVTPIALDTLKRRTLMLGGAAVAGATVIGLGGVAAAAGRAAGGAKSPSESKVLSLNTTTTAPKKKTTTTTAKKVKGKLLGRAKEVPKNSSARFTVPSSGDPGILIHSASGEFVAYDAVCPHMGCTVGYSTKNKIIVCPCHGSEFYVATGDVIVGPAPHGLKKLKVEESSSGDLYLE